MTAVKIEYCVPCRLLDQAIETQTRLLNEFGQDMDGVFIVTVNGETIWEEGVHGTNLDLDLIVGAVDNRLPAVA